MNFEWKFPFVWFDVVTYSDAKALCRWWNWGCPTSRFFPRRSETNRRFWAVIREYPST